MASRKKAVKAKKRVPVKTATSGDDDAPAGIVRFKMGFPPGIRDYIRAHYGDDWHLSLEIKDGDDGDGDDGDGLDGGGEDGDGGGGPRNVVTRRGTSSRAVSPKPITRRRRR